MLPLSIRTSLTAACFRSPLKRVFGNHAWMLSGPLTGHRIYGPGIGDYLKGIYEPEVCRLIQTLVQPGWVCVDAGAHKGYLTLLLAKLVGRKGKIFAFEAHPGNAMQTHANVRINGYENIVKVENIAITDMSLDQTKLFPGRGHSSAEWNIVGHDVSGASQEPEMEIRSESLDSYFPPKLLIDFIKMDIEGAELRAISGMARILRSSRPFLLVEFHGENGLDGGRRLIDTDYSLYDVDNARWCKEAYAKGLFHCLAVPTEHVEDFEARLGQQLTH